MRGWVKVIMSHGQRRKREVRRKMGKKEDMM
jgi:hypothetical protein